MCACRLLGRHQCKVDRPVVALIECCEITVPSIDVEDEDIEEVCKLAALTGDLQIKGLDFQVGYNGQVYFKWNFTGVDCIAFHGLLAQAGRRVSE